MKTTLITGAAGGIGQALCTAFSQSRYQVIATDKEVPHQTDCSTFIPCDLEEVCRSSQALTSLVDDVRQQLKGNGLSVLVNNAALQIVKLVEQLTVKDWSRTLNVNLIAPFLLTQAFLSELEVASGSVINISSIHAALTKPEFTAYATSKSALSGLTRSLSVELGQRIRINAISPAAIATPMLLNGFTGKDMEPADLEGMHPVGRIGEPSEVAALALFLASDAARFINGAEIGLDGGIRARLHDLV